VIASTAAEGAQRIAGVVLACGGSRRMPGRSKLLRSFDGAPVIRVVARTALDAGLDPVLVTVRPADEAVLAALAGLAVQAVPVRSPGRGRLASAASGLEALGRVPVSAAMVLLGDEPGLSAVDVSAVRDAWIAGAGELLRAAYRDRPGHPVLVDRTLFSRVLGLAAEPTFGEGVWDRLEQAGIRGIRIPVDRDAPIDVDTPSALRAARARRRRL
jgi:molybdenum cofactor cytidylyltransferase